MKAKERDDLLRALKARFEKNMHRHHGVGWVEVHARLESNPGALRSLLAMEATGGEPDVIGQDKGTGRFTFIDCSIETPTGRRSLCYDRAALDSRPRRVLRDADDREYGEQDRGQTHSGDV